MINPVIIQILSKAANQERARQVAHIQQINQIAKNRDNHPKKDIALKLQISRFAQRFALRLKGKNEKLPQVDSLTKVIKST